MKNHKKNVIAKIFTVALLALSVVLAAFPVGRIEAAITEPGFEVETVAGGFTLPTSMAFAPDGRIFVAEKGGTVRVVKNGALLPAPVITLTDINNYADRGLIGIATDPNFLTNGYLYLSYTYENTPGSDYSGPKTGRIVRVTVVGDTASESSKVVLVGTVGGNAITPSCENFAVTADCIPSDSPSHTVGGLRFGPDGKLYATLGEGANFDYADPKSLRAQNIDSLGGKLIRINADGSAPSDNPFYNGTSSSNRSKVYALGLRNAFRLNFNPTTGMLFLGDVGWSTSEEVNRVTPGANFGWPCSEGFVATSHNCTASSATTTPRYAYGHDVNGAGSVTVGAFPANGAYPAAFNTSLFFGDYAQNWIKRLVLDASGNFVSVQNFMTNADGPVDISTGPDGNIYYIAIYTGELKRITYTTGNRRPVPVISAVPTSGLLPLAVNFSSASSTDPDGDPLTYSWNFGDGATSTLANPAHTYTAAGTYNAVLTLTDSHGSAASKSITITAGNQAPTANITSPASGSLYTVGQMINVSGTGSDLEDGTLPASSFSWQIILHHNTHIHILQEFTGTKTPSFTGPDHASPDVYTEVSLTVTDSAGLTGKASINMYLNTASTTGNMIDNPSVETDSGAIPAHPASWDRGGWGTNTRVLSYPVSGFDGAKGLKTEVTSYTSGDAKWYFAPVNVTPGTTYTYSDFYTANVPTQLSAQFGLANGTFQYQYLGTVPAAGTPTAVTQTVTVPAGVQTLSVFHSLASVGVLTTDKFSLTVPGGATTTGTNLITNGSFETASSTNPANPLGWTSVAVPGTTATFGYPTLGADGGKAVHIQITNIGTDGNARWQFNEVPVTTGTEYTYEEDYKGSTIHDIIGRYTFNDNSEHFFGLKKEIPAATTWTHLTGKFVAPVNIKSVTLMSLISTNATLDLDNTKMFASGTGTPSELIPPVVAFTNPLNGNTVSGIVGLTATATDNVGVAGWFFAADGTPLQSEQSGNTITFNWDSTTVANGTHTLKITARDAVGNNSREIITVTVNNTATTTGNLILNPSLETPGTGGNPDKWSRGGWGTNNRAYTYPTAGVLGASAAKLEITSYTDGDAKWYFQDVPVTGGNTYTFSDSYKSNAATDLFARYTLSGGALSYTYLATLPATGGGGSVWASTTREIIVPANAASITIFHNIHSVGVLETDAFSLTSGTTPPPPPPPPPGSNPILNPSLETPGTGGNPDKWFRGGWGTNTRTYTYPTAGIDGASAAKLDVTSYTDGDAKWYFTDVPVTGSTSYTFTHSYKSTVPTSLTVRYTLTGGAFQYIFLSNLPATGGGGTTWTNTAQTFTTPANAVSMTIFHALTSVGVLEVDNYSLANGIADTFDRGKVSLSFDDGWLTHYTEALPILNAANKKGTFYIISQETINATPPELVQNPSLETPGTGGNPDKWFRGGWGTNTRTYTYPTAGIDGASAAKLDVTSYTDGDAKWYFQDAGIFPGQKYIIKDSYNSTAASQAWARYTMQGGTFQYVFLGTLPSTAGAWANFQQEIIPPANAVSMTFFHALGAVGSLTVDNYSFKYTQVYVDPTQMMAIQTAGHEIGGHTLHHTDLTTLTPAQQQNEIAGGRTELLGIGATPVETFAYPYGAYNASIQTTVQNAGFAAARSVDRGYNTKTTAKYALKIQQVGRTTTAAEVQAWIDQAAADKTWLILMFHQIDTDPTHTFATTAPILQQIVNYASTANVDVVTVRQGVALMNP